jgi:glycosyltransferase involved in cell wall biosynthesis
MSGRIRVAYVVSRFPAASETFVIRELDEVAADGRIELDLLSLFPSEDRFVHPRARPWLSPLRQPGWGQAVSSLLWWAARRPARLLSSLAIVVADTWREPRIMLRSLATLPLASVHARTVRAEGVDHMHAHFASYPTLSAWLCRRLTGVSYSFTAHAYDLFVEQRMLRRKVADAEFVATISSFNRQFLDDYQGTPPTPVHVVHAGLDPTAYEFRPRQPPPSGPARVLCVASLQEKKGHAVLLRALAKPGLERLSLDLVGGGELRESLEALAAELGLGERVSFHGACTESEVQAMLGATDIFVLPSIVAADGQMEGVPVALMEALACGIPTIATRMSGVPELIDDGRTGTLVEPGDVEGLAAALSTVLAGAGPDAKTGRELIEREFDVRESGRRMVELFLRR